MKRNIARNPIVFVCYVGESIPQGDRGGGGETTTQSTMQYRSSHDTSNDSSCDSYTVSITSRGLPYPFSHRPLSFESLPLVAPSVPDAGCFGIFARNFFNASNCS